MRVAIIGAGTSGLACAQEFEKAGIRPDIFEKKDKIGELFPHVSALLQLTHRPIKDQVEFLKQKYEINITPLRKIKEIIMNGPSVSKSITGDLGYLVLRGQDKSSIENQMAGNLQSAINFNTLAKLEKLSNSYEAVIVASGTEKIPKQSGIWTPLIETIIKGSVVTGQFNPDKIEMWLNTDYAKNGYAYLVPFNENSAVLTLIVPEVNSSECNNYWHHFWEAEKPDFKIVQSFELPYSAGFVFPHKIDNVYFVGNAGGFLEPLLGFGQFQGIISGVTAAQCVIKGKDYEKEVQPLLEHMIEMTEFRKSINEFENKDYDKLISILGMPVINKLIYNTNLDVIKYSSSVINVAGKIALGISPK